jgi:putative endonuclease
MSNKYTGKKGEEMAAAYLIQNGYSIVERNWRFKHWEVDIIASKGSCMHFFEIKTRSSDMYGHPEESVSKQKMVNLRNAAEEYQYLHPEWRYVQFNVLSIKMFFNQPVEIMLFEDVYF